MAVYKMYTVVYAVAVCTAAVLSPDIGRPHVKKRYQSPFLSLYEFWCLHVERTRASHRWLPGGAVCTAAVLRTPSVGSLTSPPWSLENSGREMCVVRRGRGKQTYNSRC